MTAYVVTWQIDVEAESPEGAALEAESIMHDYATDGHRPIFTVREESDRAGNGAEEIDLEQSSEEDT